MTHPPRICARKGPDFNKKVAASAAASGGWAPGGVRTDVRRGVRGWKPYLYVPWPVPPGGAFPTQLILDVEVKLENLDPQEVWATQAILSTQRSKPHARTMGSSHLSDWWLDEVAAVQVVFRLLANPASVFALLLAAGSPCFFYYHRIDGGNTPLSANLNWAVVSIAVVFPLTMSLNEAFKRRERAVLYYARWRVSCVSLMLAHRDWTWGWGSSSSNRMALPLPPTERKRKGQQQFG